MVEIVHNYTWRDPLGFLAADLSDLVFVVVDGQLRLLATSYSGQFLGSFSLVDGLTLVDQAVVPSGNTLGKAARLDVLELDGDIHVATYGPDHTALIVHGIAPVGIGNRITIGSQFAGAIVAMDSLQRASETLILAAHEGAAGVSVYSVSGTGPEMELIQSAPLPSGAVARDVVAIETVRVGDDDIALVLSAGPETLSSFRAESDGNFTPVDTLDAESGLYIAHAARLRTAEVLDDSFAIIAASGSNSLTVVRIEPGGNLTVVDHVLDTRNTRFDAVTTLDTVETSGRAYVIAGGADDGISLLLLLPDGSLLHQAVFADTAETALMNVNSLSARAVNGRIEVVVAAQGEAGLTLLQVDPGPIGITAAGTEAANTMSGTIAGDLLWGRGGDDTLSGGQGDDVLMGGAGRDLLSGGAGSDTFVFRFGETDDTITDFNRDEDRIDLSRLGRVYDIGALNIESTATGAILSFRDERIVIQSHDGASLSEADFTAPELFPTNHQSAEVAAAVQNIYGSSGNDMLGGTALNDTMSAGAGQDTLSGEAGADLLNGGIGADLASYESATAPIVADLFKPHQNAGDALGDVYISIEDVCGSAFDDLIRGDDNGNRILGHDGDDWLVGRAGADTLQGDADDDTLMGGEGADRLDGGAGTDQADYRHAAAGVIADLGYAFVNTQEAAGDSYLDVEDLHGSEHADSLRGDAEANSLWGAAGHDFLVGRAGDDSLFGGAGNDLLNGGPGRDLLDGGAGTDRIEYRMAASGVRVNLTNPEVNTGEALGDRFFSIEELRGSRFDDSLTGTDLENWLFGDLGDDRLVGLGGADQLLGREGDDDLVGGRGADTLDGGTGVDTASYTSAGDAVVADLAFGTNNTGDAAGDVYIGIENLSGSRLHDSLRGNERGNVLRGNEGNDWLAGRGGDDQLFGMKGNDVLAGGAGADTLNGGDGIDRADYRDAKTGLRADLNAPASNTGEAGGDVFVSIENLFGTSHADILRGNSAHNRFWGNGGSDKLLGFAGNDTLEGMDGDDRLNGGGGDDRLGGGNGADVFVFGSGHDTISDYQPDLDLIRVSGKLWNNEPLGVEEIFSAFAGQSGLHTVLDFGDGNSLTILNVLDFSTIMEDLSII